MQSVVIRSTAAIVLSLTVAQAVAKDVSKVDLVHYDPVELTFKAFDPQHVLISERTLLDGIAHNLSAATRWPMRVGQRDTSDAVLDTGGQTKVFEDRHDLAIQYLATTRYLSGGSTGTVLSIPVKYTIERAPDTVKVTLTFPEQGTLLREGMPFLTRKLWSMDEILADYGRLAQSLQNVELKMSSEAHGELQSPYKQEAVLGNLERLLGRPSSMAMGGAQINTAGSVTRDANYVYTIRGERRTVKVSTFPYHDGTKVAYSAALPFTLRSDGSSAGDDDAAQLHDLLQKIISD